MKLHADKPGAASTIPLAVSAGWLVLTGLAAAMPGDYWPMYGISAGFALVGFVNSRTRVRRMVALVLLSVSMTCGVMDYLVFLAGR